MKRNNFHPKFKFYNNEKPKMSLGDFSIESESYNDSIDEKTNNINNDNSFEFPKENPISSVDISNSIYINEKKKEKNEMPSIHVPFNTKEKTNNNKKELEKIDDFSLKRSTWTKENNRYSNISEIYNNNLRFLSICEDDDYQDDEDDDIVNIANSEINSLSNNNDNEDLSACYIKGFNATYKYKKDNEVEIYLEPNISKIFSSGEISDIKIDNSNSNKIENIIDINAPNKEKIDVRNNKDIINNNKLNNKEENINIIEDTNKKVVNKNENKVQNKTSKELRDSRKFFVYNKSLNKKKSFSKQKKIFQKFLCVSIDTSGLYSLDNEMEVLLLNPKITYNYPFNKMERELE